MSHSASLRRLIFFCIIWSIKWLNSTHGYIIHSKNFKTTPHTPKFELNRRSYGPDKLDIIFLVFMSRHKKKVSQHSFSSFYVATEKTVSRHSFSSFFVATEKTVSQHSFSSFYVDKKKLCRDIVFLVFMSQQKNCVATKTLEKTKNAKNGYFGLFSSPFHPRTINTCLLGF